MVRTRAGVKGIRKTGRTDSAETARKRAEAAARQARRELDILQSIVNRGPAVLFLWRAEPENWPVEFVSDNAGKILGYPAEDFMAGRVSWPGITHPEDAPRLEAEVAQYLGKGIHEWSQEYRLISKSGRIRWIQDWNRALTNGKGEVTHVQALVVDITQRKKTEEELRKSQAKLRDLASEAIRAEYRERRRIADVLHEELQQLLVGMQYRVNLMRERGTTRKSNGDVDWLLETLGRTIDVSRDLTLRLRPRVLGQAGLRPALEWLAADMKTRFGLTVNLNNGRAIRLPSDEIRSFAFDAVRELLTNVVKHAEVTAARIRTRARDGEIEIEVSDSGRGFDSSRPTQQAHFGLFSLRERVEALGGRLEVSSRPGQGTRATLILPADGAFPAESSG